MIGSIDVHTHIVPGSFPAYSGTIADVPWPQMVHDGCGHAMINIAGKPFRTVQQAAWDVGCRLAAMEEMQTHIQVISPMPELLSYWLPTAAAVDLLRHVNAEIAVMVSAAPDRMIGLAAIPLQDVGKAVTELRYAVENFGLKGVEIGSNINGVPLADPRFEPFFEAAEALDIPIFVHAIRAVGKDRLIGLPMLEQIIAFPGEIGLTIGGLIASGTLARRPRLRIAFSHGGGSVLAICARMQHFWSALPKFAETLVESPIETARRLYFDSAVFEPGLIHLIAETFGIERLMLGSDFPFGGYERHPTGLLERAGLSASDIGMVERINPRRYLGIDLEGEA
ncbi:aminocarboxymuconate-semialdehyde decarboxylase [Sphingomonas vulcanisoli]|uniref:Aminocarboxymuconate-semialdehyde decarboxylase n=1 Tax=Sphingomonas vulcanisoli TaxID=1658060 RepID=A0ABX0TTB1_9SPHN|nr:amidohydrolase family protein [Sphingomonas vulcanisoli]NIJ08754.1 aminocarboxymuconate-semialdehyde decarboxylase [Sphingomonas vulcanisoli]